MITLIKCCLRPLNNVKHRIAVKCQVKHKYIYIYKMHIFTLDAKISCNSPNFSKTAVKFVINIFAKTSLSNHFCSRTISFLRVSMSSVHLSYSVYSFFHITNTLDLNLFCANIFIVKLVFSNVFSVCLISGCRGLEVRCNGIGSFIPLDIYISVCNRNSPNYIESPFFVWHHQTYRHINFQGSQEKNGIT